MTIKFVPGYKRHDGRFVPGYIALCDGDYIVHKFTNQHLSKALRRANRVRRMMAEGATIYTALDATR